MPDRRTEQLKKMGEQLLTQKQEIVGLESKLDFLCDNLLTAGNDVDMLRAFWPKYLTPEERESAGN